MSKTIKLTNDTYIDSSAVMHNKKTLKSILQSQAEIAKSDITSLTSIKKITGFSKVITSTDVSADTSNSRITIKNTSVLEIGGTICGSSSGAIHAALKLTDSSGNLIVNNTSLHQQDGFIRLPLNTCIVEIDSSKTYYLSIEAGPYNSDTFTLNDGFVGTYNTTLIYAKKIA